MSDEATEFLREKLGAGPVQVRDVDEHAWDRIFSEHSFGFRPKRSARTRLWPGHRSILQAGHNIVVFLLHCPPIETIESQQNIIDRQF